MGTMTPAQIVDWEILRKAVADKMFCPMTGLVLDVRRAVLVEIKKAGLTLSTMTLAAEAWDRDGHLVEKHIASPEGQQLELTLHVIDGRELGR